MAVDLSGFAFRSFPTPCCCCCTLAESSLIPDLPASHFPTRHRNGARGRSYTVGNEDGTKQDAQTKATPSGPVYRQIMSVLGRFMGGLELDGLAPGVGWIVFEAAGIGASTAAGAAGGAGWPRAASVDRVSALAPTRAVPSASHFGAGSGRGGRGGRRTARTYVAYVPAGVNAIKVSLRAHTPAADSCECEWLDTVGGKVTRGQSVRTGNWTRVAVPEAAGAAGVALTVACY